MKNLINRNQNCRGCRGRNLIKIFSFGPTPLANAFLPVSQKHSQEYIFPLDVYYCKNCSLVQLIDIVNPEFMFKDYVYISSTSPVFIRHFENFASHVFKRFDLKSSSLVVDIGSNDGILLLPFKKMGTRVLGIDPALTVAKIAESKGIKTVTKFFSPDLSKKITKKYGKADVITGTNVFAHVNDLRGLLIGVKHLMKDNGVFIIEVPYLLDFLKKNLFDTVYHEHLSYFSIKSLTNLFDRSGMRIFDVQRVITHGGSIRVFVEKKCGNHKIELTVAELIKKEKDMGLTKLETYRGFYKRILQNKVALTSLLVKLKLQGKSVAGYGAPGKGNTLLNYFGIGSDLLDYIVDDSPQKQGLYTPGRRIPVVNSKQMYKKMPDYLLIIAWNFAGPIIANHVQFKELGGKFIIPVPRPQII